MPHPQLFEAIQQEIIDCQSCPRLVTWCQEVAREKRRMFQEDTYWGKPVPSFGSAEASLLIVGLAPAAHGANRTGRMFTGDRSGDWLYRAMHKAGFASQPTSEHAGDGLELYDALITAVAHCAPPANKPTTEEIQSCRRHLVQELQVLQNLRVIIALGKLAFDEVYATYHQAKGLGKPPSPRPKFTHLAMAGLQGGVTLIGSYHPSQQNTFTGKLTESMLDAVFQEAKMRIDASK